MSNIKSNIIFMSKFMSKIICQKFEVVYKMGVLIVFFFIVIIFNIIFIISIYIYVKFI